jgi:TRAP-type C4-dicarboxylate transport system substrate-binding protein
MKRRSMLGAMLGTAAAATVSSPTILAQQRITWTMISPFPPSDITAQRFGSFAKAVEKATDGRFRMRVLVAGQHPYQYRDGLRIVTEGLAELSHTGLTYMTSVESWFGLPLVPFAVPYDKQEKFMEQWHEQVVRPYFQEKHKVEMLAYFLDSGGWGNAIHTPVPLKDFESLKGLKIRAHDKNTAALAQVLGAIPTTVPYSELYVSVQRKSIDGVMTSLNGAHAQKLWELLKYTDLFEPYFGTDEILVSQAKWQSLPRELQTQIGGLFQEWFSMKPMRSYHSELNEKILEEAKTKYGATVTKMSGSFREEARKRTAHLLDDYVAGGGEMAKRSADVLRGLA